MRNSDRHFLAPSLTGGSNLGDTSPHTTIGLYAASTAGGSAVPEALRLEGREPMGAALERRRSCGRSAVEGATGQASPALPWSCGPTAGTESDRTHADSHYH